MIDASHVKVHHTPLRQGGNQDMGRTKGAQLEDTYGRGCAWQSAPNPYYRRSRADCSESENLIGPLQADYLIADKAMTPSGS